jgi:hypothetical protein
VVPKKKASDARVFFVIPPARLKENMRGELKHCPGVSRTFELRLETEQAAMMASRGSTST